LVAASRVWLAENLKKFQHVVPPALSSLRSPTFTVTLVTSPGVVLLRRVTVNVPVVLVLLMTFRAIPSTVIAPGVKAAESRLDVLTTKVLAAASFSAVLSHRFHEVFVLQFPVPLLM